ncbi:MAG: helix-turn-helix domain-containing protein [Akkermansiaceae bacterium]|jgi:AraC-like DNA-binding protein|nr:helix-turn-helix domain-containing protein [Akkermansiaceae bacterium]MDP4646991.1 helix-turn-helix domain-containing protein [Akkermansiaceae bacterium]MDP4722637.1 helix-turn-helix domain-containing protein [Akkermansiaceae bacterium]MDP4780222.1 helix-turn-helix domain-containing protein [Akkermansiaceae bacterium]MDP4847529.1 helix-turn-helix domain-containing protein [Akkermansiaceae bacterium]
MRRILKIDDWFHPDGFPISVERREPQEAFEPHAHEFAELVIVTGGKCLHVTGNDSWELTAGDVFVIAGAREHEYQNLEDLRLVNILYQPSQLKMGLLDLTSVAGYHALFTLEPSRRNRKSTKGRLHLAAKEMAQIVELADRLEHELEAREPGFGFMATATFMQLIGQLSRFYSSSPSPDGKALLRIGEALSHLERNIHHEIDLEELASIANMSQRSFLRVFQSATGASPLAWVIGQRINRACSLLRRTDRRITEIAFDVGFNDSNYFTRQFRKVTGFSPREYRLRHGVE